MPGPFSWFPQQNEVGGQDKVKKFYQNQTLNPMQQAAQAMYQAKALQGMLMPQGQSFEPIYQEAMRAHRENTVPGIMNQVGQRPNSSAYQQAFGRGNEDLAVRLGALRSQWQDTQNERAAQNARAMMQQGMAPSFETVYAPVPTESAKGYLQQQGLPVTPENIQKYLPLFEPQQSLGQNLQQGVRNLPETIQGGPKQIQDYFSRLKKGALASTQSGTPLANPIEGLPGTVEGMLKRTPQVAEAVEKSLVGANQQQIAAKNWVLANKGAHMPILTSNLQAQDWPFLEAAMKSQSPEIRNMIYSLDNRGQLGQLYQLLEKFNKAPDIKAQESILKQVNSLKAKFGRESRRTNA